MVTNSLHKPCGICGSLIRVFTKDCSTSYYHDIGDVTLVECNDTHIVVSVDEGDELAPYLALHPWGYIESIDTLCSQNNEQRNICEQCGRKSRLISEEQACGKTFEMTYERKDASQSLSCSKLSNKWISVDEQKPEHYYPVLVFNGDWIDSAWWSDHESSWLSIYNNSTRYDEITHWMPLPSCPEIPDNCES